MPRGVKVHPGDQALKTVAVQPNAFMAVPFGEQGQQLAVGGHTPAHERLVLFERQLRQVPIGKGHQAVVRRGGGKVQAGGRLVFALRTVARHAVSIQNRLHQPVVAERPGALRAGCQFRRFPHGGQRRGVHPRCRVATLVAPDARERLVRLHVGQRSHRLHGQPLAVERLKEHGQPRGDAKISRPVLLHRHGSQHKLAGLLLGNAQDGDVLLRLRFRRHGDDSQPLDGPPGHPVEPPVDVLNQEPPLLRARPVDPFGQNGRPRARANRDRVHARYLGVAVQKHQVAEGVVKVDAHGVARILRVVVPHQLVRRQPTVAPAYQEVFFAQRIRPGVIHADVAFRLRKRHLGREPRDRPIELRPPSAIQQAQRSAGNRMMGRGREDQLAGVGNRPRFKHTLRPPRVVAVDQLRAGPVGAGRPETEEMPVEAVDVVPSGVKDPPVVGHRRRPLEALERRDRPQVLSVPVHSMEREDRYGPPIAAPASNVGVGTRGLTGGGAGQPGLKRKPFARGKEHHVPVGQVAGVEIVVTPEGQLTHAAAVDVHLEDLVERVLRKSVLVDLVLDAGQVRVVLAVGEQHLGAVVGKLRAKEIAFRPVAGDAFDLRVVSLKTLQQTDSPARPRPPAVVLVGHVGKHPRRPFEEENRVEVQQRIGQRHAAHGPLGLEIEPAADFLGRVGREFLAAFGNLRERFGF